MLVANGEDPGTWLAVLGLVLMEEEGDATLSVLILPLLRSDRHSQHGCEGATDIVRRVGFVGNAHKGRTRQPLHGALIPFNNGTLNLMLLQNMENVGRSVTGLLGAGGVGMRGNPDDNRASSLLSVLVAGRKASGLKGGVLNAAFIEQDNHLRSDNMPNRVERRSEDSFGGLDRARKPPGGPRRRRNWEGIRLEIGAVKKLRRVHGDTIPVINPLEIGDKAWGDNRSIRRNAKLREECRSIGQGGG